MENPSLSEIIYSPEKKMTVVQHMADSREKAERYFD